MVVRGSAVQDGVVIKFCGLENGAVCPEGNFLPVLSVLLDYIQFGFGYAALVFLVMQLAIAVHFYDKFL